MASEHGACVAVATAMTYRVSERTIALRHVVEWWDALPPRLRQDIEGSGAEPGCIAAARRLSAEK